MSWALEIGLSVPYADSMGISHEPSPAAILSHAWTSSVRVGAQSEDSESSLGTTRAMFINAKLGGFLGGLDLVHQLPPSLHRCGRSRAYNLEDVSKYLTRVGGILTVRGTKKYQLNDYIQSDSTNAHRIAPVPTAIQIRGPSDIASQSDARAVQPRGLDIHQKNIDKTQAPCLITIEGLPSPSCIAFIASKYRLRPEYWLSNLSFGRQSPT
jgi:hypothetical protein